MDRLSKFTRRAIAAASVAALAMIVGQGRALAQPVGTDNYMVSYYDVASSTRASASGYGGPGFSGGSGDGLVRIVNPTHNSTVQKGTLCAMIYVFDDIEEEQTCCGCPVTPDGLRTLSVINNLTTNFGVNGANLVAGVIKIVTNDPNADNRLAQIPAATLQAFGVYSAGPWACDPTANPITGSITSTLFLTTSDVTGNQEGLRAWETHTETMAPVFPATQFTTSASVEEFASAPLDSTELQNLTSTCDNLVKNGSFSGTCSCGFGDSFSLKKTARN